MLFSAESSLELVLAHVAALRSGIVVVPANTAYRERELGHVVRDARSAGGPARRSRARELGLGSGEAWDRDPHALPLISPTRSRAGSTQRSPMRLP